MTVIPFILAILARDQGKLSEPSVHQFELQTEWLGEYNSNHRNALTASPGTGVARIVGVEFRAQE